jgi:hypothetical protein
LRSRILLGCVLAFAGASAVASSAIHAAKAGDGDAPAARFDASSALYGATELGIGGRPLYQALFPSGWPTTKEYRRLTLEDGEAAFVDNVAALLGSGLGVPLTASSGERARLEDLQKLDPKTPSSLPTALKERFEAFRQLAGLPGAVDERFIPVFLPFRRGEPSVSSFDETKPATWAWSSKTTESLISLDAIGLSIYAETLLAEQQLVAEHKVDTGAGSQTFVGRSDIEGFVALCALDCAVAAMNEVRNKLCIDLKVPASPVLGPYPKVYDPAGEFARRNYFPHLFAPQLGPATVTYALGGGADAKKSHLFDQAALLLGVCEIARASDGKTGPARFFTGDKKQSFFDPQTSQQATDLAVFIFESLYAIHCNSSGKLSSFASYENWGDLLRIEDAGLILLALESFTQLTGPKSMNLGAAQKRARNMIERVASFVCSVQKTSNVAPGFCDAFNLDSESATEDRASLAAQGLAIRGLLAAKRAFATPAFASSAAAKPDVLTAAQRTLEFLEKKRWDPDRRAYIDAPGSRDKVKLRAFDAFAVLGGLRDLALETKDVRYLLRYRTFLTTLRTAGLQLAGSSREGDGSDGVKKASAVGLAPVATAEITLP